MEKKQHQQEDEMSQRTGNTSLPQQAPGQQLPAKEERDSKTAQTTGIEKHSDSSFPQSDNETLGTP